MHFVSCRPSNGMLHDDAGRNTEAERNLNEVRYLSEQQNKRGVRSVSLSGIN